MIFFFLIPDSQWSVMRRFRQFRDLHMSLVTTYGPLITSLPFPSRRLFGNKSDQVSGMLHYCLLHYGPNHLLL